LCNDKPVLGPWVNNRWVNYFTGAIIAVLIILSIILTVSVLFPDATNAQVILGIMGGGGVVAVIAALVIMALSQNGESTTPAEEIAAPATSRDAWRMPPLDQLAPAKLSLAAKTWMGALRLYLVVAVALVLFRVVMLAIGHG
jgi:Mn2+/Fe2+ NRAMP family transporter